MRVMIVCLMMFFCARLIAKETSFVGSTPANGTVRSFLGISLSDSIDFIRWSVTLSDNHFKLHCNYGVSKPNTNGFINDGRTIAFEGVNEWKQNYYQLKIGQRSLTLLIINNDLLQIAGNNLQPLVGNGGWSYNLNHTTSILKGSRIAPITIAIKDSLVFDGRTGCAVPGVVANGEQCYKLKWRIIFYGSDNSKYPGGCRIVGTAWRSGGGLTGKWTLTKNGKGQDMYHIVNTSNKVSIYLIAINEKVFLFTDKDGNCLVGDHDFSYSLNRVSFK